MRLTASVAGESGQPRTRPARRGTNERQLVEAMGLASGKTAVTAADGP